MSGAFVVRVKELNLGRLVAATDLPREHLLLLLNKLPLLIRLYLCYLFLCHEGEHLPANIRRPLRLLLLGLLLEDLVQGNLVTSLILVLLQVQDAFQIATSRH